MRTPRAFTLVVSVLIVLSGAKLRAAEPALVASFDQGERPQEWKVNLGIWEPKDGVLVCRELEKDHHAAASRWQVPFHDAVITAKVKFAGGKGFHIGFDPAPGELDKKGHLATLALTPQGARILKHKDKADEASKDQVMATATADGLSDGWIQVEVRCEGEKITAKVGPNMTLTASDPTFKVGKPTVVFRVMGGDVLLDDVRLEVLNK